MFIKRIFDVVASILGLIFLIPLFLLIAIIIKLKMPGPVFFCQRRTGRHGKAFTIYKYRTMVMNHRGSTISVKGESRITPLGERLRKYKLDELPELLNVLKGEMSLVGPRPDMSEYVEKLNGQQRLILKMRPGITGPASLKFANEEAILASVRDPKKYNDEVLWPEKVRMNLEYYHTRSFIGDLVIIFKTIFRNTA
jgi:lipopolysaccharide/colanic/teichoic acid biosynthesis glycosyltransferase